MAEAAHSAPDEAAVWAALEEVKDPEIPVLSILNLGVVRGVDLDGDELEVTITPTYSGCPAMDMIEAQIKEVLVRAGYAGARVKTVLSPPWTTDWIDADGRAKLLEFGIAPPEKASTSKQALFGPLPEIACPQCGSKNTEMVSEFGSTACKALYKCGDCLEPFDYFKCI